MADDSSDSEPTKRGRGRPSKITQELIKKVVAAIKRGTRPIVAAKKAGASARSHEDWMRRGEAAAEGDDLYIAYATAVNTAEAELEAHLSDVAMKHIIENPKDAMPFMERRFSEGWAKREKHDHSGTVDHRVGVVMLPPEEALPGSRPVTVELLSPSQPTKRLPKPEAASGGSEGSLVSKPRATD